MTSTMAWIAIGILAAITILLWIVVLGLNVLSTLLEDLRHQNKIAQAERERISALVSEIHGSLKED